MKKTILLFGPRIGFSKASYGGGTGGYTRNMSTYLNNFESDVFELIPCFHTVRSSEKSLINNFVVRFFIDAFNLLCALLSNKPKCVHVLAQYRGAMPREFFTCLCCKLFRVNYIYEIKAGQFDTWYLKTNYFNKIMVRFVIKHSSKILCEGHRYIGFIENEFGKHSTYWPNFVPSDEIPDKPLKKSRSKTLKVCFIGYCYYGKGVFELVRGLNNLNIDKYPVELHLVGQESDDFKKYLDEETFSYNIVRHGKLEHQNVLNVLTDSDVFCLPTKHSGEGHNNSINEAMMLNVPIICTRHGFLEDVLSDNKAFFIEDLDHINITFEHYLDHETDKMTNNAYAFFMSMLHSDVVIPKLDLIYKES